MINPDYQFEFDVNFSFGRDSVFTVVNNDSFGETPIPPISGPFILLDGSPFLLLSGEDFVLL